MRVEPFSSRPSNRTLIAGQTLTITNIATDANSPPQILTFGLVSAPTNALLNSASGIFSMQVNGISGPDYILQAATNLTPPIIWQAVVTNLGPVPPHQQQHDELQPKILPRAVGAVKVMENDNCLKWAAGLFVQG